MARRKALPIVAASSSWLSQQLPSSFVWLTQYVVTRRVFRGGGAKGRGFACYSGYGPASRPPYWAGPPLDVHEPAVQIELGRKTFLPVAGNPAHPIQPFCVAHNRNCLQGQVTACPRRSFLASRARPRSRNKNSPKTFQMGFQWQNRSRLPGAIGVAPLCRRIGEALSRRGQDRNAPSRAQKIAPLQQAFYANHITAMSRHGAPRKQRPSRYWLMAGS